MIRRTLDSTRTDTRFPYTSLVRSAMQAAFRHLPRCIEARQVRPPVQIDDDAAARIMLRRHNRYWFPRDVDLQFQQPRVNRREMLLDERSEEHTSELQSLMRISYADFCLKQKITH